MKMRVYINLDLQYTVCKVFATENYSKCWARGAGPQVWNCQFETCNPAPLALQKEIVDRVLSCWGEISRVSSRSRPCLAQCPLNRRLFWTTPRQLKKMVHFPGPSPCQIWSQWVMIHFRDLSHSGAQFLQQIQEGSCAPKLAMQGSCSFHLFFFPNYNGNLSPNSHIIV